MQSDNEAVSRQESIPLSVPEIRGNEWKYVKECLDTGWVSSVGSYVDRFEQAVASYLGVNHAVATVNGTAALHATMFALSIGRIDRSIEATLDRECNPRMTTRQR